MTHRTLSHDEKKAAEAAFRGLPCDPTWSTAARAIYDGIVKALPAGHAGESLFSGSVMAPPATGAVSGLAAGGDASAAETSSDSSESSVLKPAGETPVTSRQEAVERGLLVDVSGLATELGLSIPIGISKPLWETGITVAGQIGDTERDQRVRDILMALRLSLGGSRDLPSVMQFPALLSFPPESSPRLCSVIAVAHRDADAPFALTLLHPSEVHQIYPFLS